MSVVRLIEAIGHDRVFVNARGKVAIRYDAPDEHGRSLWFLAKGKTRELAVIAAARKVVAQARRDGEKLLQWPHEHMKSAGQELLNLAERIEERLKWTD